LGMGIYRKGIGSTRATSPESVYKATNLNFMETSPEEFRHEGTVPGSLPLPPKKGGEINPILTEHGKEMVFPSESPEARRSSWCIFPPQPAVEYEPACFRRRTKCGPSKSETTIAG